MSDNCLILSTLDEVLDLISDMREIDTIAYRTGEDLVHIALRIGAAVELGTADLTAAEFSVMKANLSNLLDFVEIA